MRADASGIQANWHESIRYSIRQSLEIHLLARVWLERE
jgi:hypothetical protein